jgi:hypothetical protein
MLGAVRGHFESDVLSQQLQKSTLRPITQTLLRNHYHPLTGSTPAIIGTHKDFLCLSAPITPGIHYVFLGMWVRHRRAVSRSATGKATSVMRGRGCVLQGVLWATSEECPKKVCCDHCNE